MVTTVESDKYLCFWTQLNTVVENIARGIPVVRMLGEPQVPADGTTTSVSQSYVASQHMCTPMTREKSQNLCLPGLAYRWPPNLIFKRASLLKLEHGFYLIFQII